MQIPSEPQLLYRTGFKRYPIALAILLTLSLHALARQGRSHDAGVMVEPLAGTVSVSVVPTSAAVVIHQSRQFNATVRNSANTAVIWEVNGVQGGNSTVGTIGLTGLYTAPATVPAKATVTVTAVSKADATKSASAVVTITPPQVTVTLTPASVAIASGGSQQFTANVANAADTSVTWEVNGVLGGTAQTGTITTSGLYIAPNAAPSPGIALVTATSHQDPSSAAIANITIGTGLAFYVSTTGNDANSGSFTAPWRTIQHAANTAIAGDTVYVLSGVYNEVVTLAHSGSAAAGYITFESYPGQTAIVDGTGLSVPGGQFGLFTIQNQSYLAISGFEIRNYSTNTTASVPIGIYITGAGSNIQILGNRIHDISTTAKSCNANALGMAVYGNSAPASINNLTISGNEIYQLTTGCSETMSLNGNVENWIVSGNLIHDNNNIGIDAIGFEGVSHVPAYDQARNGVISGNIVYNITSYDNPAYGRQYSANGIYVDGGTQITIERNLVRNVDIGIEMASEHANHYTSYVTARSNLVFHANSVGITIGGYAASVGGTQNCNIVNNTMFDNDTQNTGSGEFQIQFHASSNIFDNNILSATSQGLFVNNYTNSSPTPASLDYNLYFSSTGAAGGTWVWTGVTHTGFTSYRSATGQDAHSSFADPLLVNAAMLNLQVQPSSPAVNAGTNLGASLVGTLDFAGNARVQGANIDLGAYEQP